MSAVALPFVQNTPEWIDARRDSIGSSDLPILTGNSPYRESPYSLWCYKTRILEPEPTDEETQEMWDLGHLLEDDIAERYTYKTGRPLKRANRTLRHPESVWRTASLDRVSAVKGERLIVELKWVPYRYWSGAEAVPPYVQDQVQWQLHVTGWPLAHVAVLLGGKFEWHEIEPDPEYQENLVYIARWFRDLVERGEAPPVDGSDATRRALVRRYPSDDGSVLEPTAELHALMNEWRVAERRAQRAAEAEAKVENAVRSIFESHAEAASAGYVKSEAGSWKATYRKGAGWTRYDHKAIAHDYRRALDEIAARYPTVRIPAEVDAIESLHSEAKEGNRTLRKTWRGEEAPWT